MTNFINVRVSKINKNNEKAYVSIPMVQKKKKERKHKHSLAW